MSDVQTDERTVSWAELTRIYTTKALVRRNTQRVRGAPAQPGKGQLTAHTQALAQPDVCNACLHDSLVLEKRPAPVSTQGMKPADADESEYDLNKGKNTHNHTGITMIAKKTSKEVVPPCPVTHCSLTVL